MHVRSDFTVELSDEEARIADKNAFSYTESFGPTIRKCANPACQYPLSSLIDYSEAIGFGKVCLLCHELFWVVRQRMFFVNAENTEKAEYEAAVRAKKKMMEGGL